MGHLTGRYDEWHLGGFRDDEALEAVYNYAYTYQVPITEATAPYIAQVCENDPYYIAATISNHPEKKDLTTEEGVRDALAFETVAGQGRIARVWLEYLHDAFARVNDVNARKIVLYLAKYEQLASAKGHIAVQKGKLADHERSVEVDLHAVHTSDDGTDLMVEVKDWASKPSMDAVRRFLDVKNALDAQLKRRTVFVFYSENGLSEDAAAALAEAGVLVLDPAKLASFEVSSW